MLALQAGRVLSPMSGTARPDECKSDPARSRRTRAAGRRLERRTVAPPIETRSTSIRLAELGGRPSAPPAAVSRTHARRARLRTHRRRRSRGVRWTRRPSRAASGVVVHLDLLADAARPGSRRRAAPASATTDCDRLLDDGSLEPGMRVAVRGTSRASPRSSDELLRDVGARSRAAQRSGLAVHLLRTRARCTSSEQPLGDAGGAARSRSARARPDSVRPHESRSSRAARRSACSTRRSTCSDDRRRRQPEPLDEPGPDRRRCPPRSISRIVSTVLLGDASCISSRRPCGLARRRRRPSRRDCSQR